MIALSVDLGHARTGLAVSDKSGFLASPLCVITEYNDEKLIEKIAQKAVETGAEILIVGLPKNMDGTEGESAIRCRDIAGKLGERTGLPYHMQDERGTTITAHEYLSAGSVYGKKRKQKVDAAAATIILQDYLDSRKG